MRDKIDRIKEALLWWAYLETKDMDERKIPKEVKQRRKYHLRVLNDFAEITSVIESKGGEQPKRANLEGVNAKKERK